MPVRPSKILWIGTGAVLVASGATALVQATVAADASQRRADQDPVTAAIAGASIEDQHDPRRRQDGVPLGSNVEFGVDGSVLLRPPPVPTPQRPKRDPYDGRTALAYQFNAPIFSAPSAKRDIIGIVRRNTTVPLETPIRGSGCGGQWYRVSGNGYICSRIGFNVSRDPELSEALQTTAPARDHTLPFTYAKVTRKGAPIYSRIPTPEQERAANETTDLAFPVRQRASGVLLVAIDRYLEDEGREFVRTIRGQYLRSDDIAPKAEPTMRGEDLEESSLPLAFVFEDEVSIQSTQTQQDIGIAEKFARFEVVGERVVGEVNYVEAVVGLVPASAVRIAKKVRRPPEIPAGAQWIHVDLGEQVLIAYEGDTPLRATLVSSGKPGYEPPLGVFRVHKKYVSKTMAGEDDVEGTYEVAQVPWILYYWGSFALHGAYWHDDFGTVRSHGCTNIPPYDAHWLFHWARPKLPRGWHGAVGVDGPWIYTSA